MGLWDAIKKGLGAEQTPPPPPPPLQLTGPQERARRRPWIVPFHKESTVPEDITFYGDARVAIPEFDGGAMQELLTPDSVNRVWIGESSHALTSNRLFEFWYSGNRHLLTVAPTGSGKGSCVIIPNLVLKRVPSCVCIDPKGQNAAITRRGLQKSAQGFPARVHLLNPFNEHGMGTARYNPLAVLDINSPNIVAEVSGLAESLIITEGNDPHWSESARVLVAGLILHALEHLGKDATLPKVRALLTQDEENFLLTMKRMSMSKYPFIAQRANRFMMGTEEVQNIISNADSQTAFLDDPAIAHVLGGSDFAMLDLKKEPTTVFIILPARFMAAYARFFRVIVVSALDQLCSVPGGLRTLFILDEFPILGHLSSVVNAFGLARGYNVQLWPFVQDLNQLKSNYEGEWETFIANAGVVQWFTPNDAFTAQYLSNRIGNTTVRYSVYNESTTFGKSQSPGQMGQGVSGSKTGNTNENYTGVPFFSPQALMDLPDYYQLITLAGLKYPILATREHYYEWPKNPRWKNGLTLCDPDPFHGGPAQQAVIGSASFSPSGYQFGPNASMAYGGVTTLSANSQSGVHNPVPPPSS